MICLMFIPFLPIINKWCWGAMSICMFTGTEVWRNTSNGISNSKLKQVILRMMNGNDCILPFLSHKYLIGICQMLQLTNVLKYKLKLFHVAPPATTPANFFLQIGVWDCYLEVLRISKDNLGFQMVFKRFLKTFWNVQVSVLISALLKLMLLPSAFP